MSPSVEQWRREADESQRRSEERRRWHRDGPTDYLARAVIIIGCLASALLVLWVVSQLLIWGVEH